MISMQTLMTIDVFTVLISETLMFRRSFGDDFLIKHR